MSLDKKLEIAEKNFERARKERDYWRTEFGKLRRASEQHPFGAYYSVYLEEEKMALERLVDRQNIDFATLLKHCQENGRILKTFDIVSPQECI